MDLGTASLFDLPATARHEVDEAAPAPLSASDEHLVRIRGHRSVIADAQVAEVREVAAWALLHVVDDETAAATITERGLDTGLPVAGPGAPLISDFTVMELATLLGRTADSGRNYVGQVVELSSRLPMTWGRLLAAEVPVWKALRIADHTRLLPQDAAAYVDRQLAPFAHTVGWAQVERLVEEALVRFDPDAAEAKRQDDAETRHVDLGLDDVGPSGIAHGTTALDVDDALALEEAVQRRARLLGQCGDTDSLDVRRAKALGELAREDLLLDLPVSDPTTGEVTRTMPGKQVTIVYHVSDDAIVARCGNTRTPVVPGHLAEILSRPGTRTIVRPVLDLAGHQPVDAYEVPDRLRTQVELRDPHCVYPHCGKPAERCDLDHVDPHAAGGPTCPCNLAPLCRGHHRLKTAGRATYRVLSPGSYHWHTRVGDWLVDRSGSHLLTSHPVEPVPPDQ